MPTVVITDVSASMLRPADPTDPSTTRQDVAQRGILHLLHHIEQWHEFEPVCMISMSSSCQVLVPFDKTARANHKQLRTSLYGMEVGDTSNVSLALETACKQLEENYGESVSGCQVVLVVDGGPSFLELRELERTLPRLPRSVVFHTVYILESSLYMPLRRKGNKALTFEQDARGSDEELEQCVIYKPLFLVFFFSFEQVAMGSEEELEHCVIYKTLAQAQVLKSALHSDFV